MSAKRDQLLDWQQFILDYGFRANVHELAAVLGVKEQEVQAARLCGATKRRKTGLDFSQLFTLWHGRPPEEAEWPAPQLAHPKTHQYAWQSRELTLLATLVGTLGAQEIAQSLTERLIRITGDKNAVRTRNAVIIKMQSLGLTTFDMVGGILVSDAGREIGSVAVVRQAITRKELEVERVGSKFKIAYADWEEWKTKRNFPPKGYIQLSTLKEPLGILSDKLSEFARAGLIPTAVRCNPFGAGIRSTKFGTWYVSPETAAQLLADRHAGRPMPWHSQPNNDNLKVTFKLWSERKHPAHCATCATIWGDAGAPNDFEDYQKRYPPLAHGAKRHLTRKWDPGMTFAAVAKDAGVPLKLLKKAIENGMINVTVEGKKQYISKTEATRWKARKCPDGEHHTSWTTLAIAQEQYLFTEQELLELIKAGDLPSRVMDSGPHAGSVAVPRHLCAVLREKRGFSEEEAAARAGVSVAKFRLLLKGADWRKAEGIPLSTVQSVIKRLESKEGYSLEEAAAKLEVSLQWVHERVQDGTVRLMTAKWDVRRPYLTEPMMKRLEAAKSGPARKQRLSAEWMRMSMAAHEAGVSPATIKNWESAGELTGKPVNTGVHYHREAVRAKARLYWDNQRFKRATPPQWLQQERTAAAVAN